ncbi:hypothetical protein LEMLEM_LOCUS4586, partial [Lemmus lemmus]
MESQTWYLFLINEKTFVKSLDAPDRDVTSVETLRCRLLKRLTP